MNTSIERDKYELYWRHEIGRQVAPCEVVVDQFIMECLNGGLTTVLDLGCGTGRCAKRMYDYNLQVTAFDIARNCMDDGIDKFVVGCAWELPFEDGAFDIVFSTDVLEHIPTPRVGTVLREIGRVSPRAYLEWADFKDGTGPIAMGEQAHLTIHSVDWWGLALAAAGLRIAEIGQRNMNGRGLSGGYARIGYG